MCEVVHEQGPGHRHQVEQRTTRVAGDDDEPGHRESEVRVVQRRSGRDVQDVRDVPQPRRQQRDGREHGLQPVVAPQVQAAGQQQHGRGEHQPVGVDPEGIEGGAVLHHQQTQAALPDHGRAGPEQAVGLVGPHCDHGRRRDGGGRADPGGRHPPVGPCAGEQERGDRHRRDPQVLELGPQHLPGEVRRSDLPGVPCVPPGDREQEDQQRRSPRTAPPAPNRHGTGEAAERDAEQHDDHSRPAHHPLPPPRPAPALPRQGKRWAPTAGLAGRQGLSASLSVHLIFLIVTGACRRRRWRRWSRR